MQAVKFVLKLLTGLIYVSFAAIVLYFPCAELLAYVGREMRMFNLHQTIPIRDVFLPALLLTLIYACIQAIQRWISPRHEAREAAADRGNTAA